VRNIALSERRQTQGLEVLSDRAASKPTELKTLGEHSNFNRLAYPDSKMGAIAQLPKRVATLKR